MNEERFKPGSIVRIVGNKRFNAQKHKLAVVVPTPKAKLRKLQKAVNGQDAQSGLPIGGWHYVLCLQGFDPGNLKPCSIQGNAMRPDDATCQEKDLAECLLQRYNEAQETLETAAYPLCQEVENTRESESRSKSYKAPEMPEDHFLCPRLLDYCEKFQNCRSVPEDSIQTVTAGLTLFGMRCPDITDIPSMLYSWELLQRDRAHARCYYKSFMSVSARSPDTLQELARREQHLASMEYSQKVKAPQRPSMIHYDGWISHRDIRQRALFANEDLSSSSD